MTMAELDKDVEKGPEPPRKPFRWGRFSLLKRIFFLDVEPFIYHGYRRRLETEVRAHCRICRVIARPRRTTSSRAHAAILSTVAHF